MTRCLFAAVVVACTIPAISSLAQVTSVTDSYSTALDDPIELPAPGVLANDISEDSLGARLIAGPIHGEGLLFSDGSLTYTPAAGFDGRDTLIYVAQVLQPIVFVIDSTSSNITVAAGLRSSFGSDDDTAASRASGTLTTFLLPHEPPFSEVHVADLRVVFIDPLQYDFSVLFASLSADIEAGEMLVTMTESAGPVPGNGAYFEQPDNLLKLEATVELSGIQESTENVSITNVATLGGLIELTPAGDSLRMELPLNYEGTFEVSSADVDFAVSGIVFAMAPYEPAEESAETIVQFNVGSVASSTDGLELPTTTTLHAAYPNPFNPQAVVSYELASDADVELSLFDVMGREVRTLVDRRQPAGRYDVLLEAGTLPSGVYLLHLRAGAVNQTSKVVLSK
jgi:hypothetical protein